MEKLQEKYNKGSQKIVDQIEQLRKDQDQLTTDFMKDSEALMKAEAEKVAKERIASEKKATEEAEKSMGVEEKPKKKKK